LSFFDIFFDGTVYDDVVALWEATVRSCFDEDIFPAAQTFVVRCEDFLFGFSAVMQALVDRGLPLVAEATEMPLFQEPLDSPAKGLGHPGCTHVWRNELLDYYSDPAKRFEGLSAEHVTRLLCVDVRVAGPLGYCEGALRTWCRDVGDGRDCYEP